MRRRGRLGWHGGGRGLRRRGGGRLLTGNGHESLAVGDHVGAEAGDGVENGRIAGALAREFFQAIMNRPERVDVRGTANLRVEAVEFIKMGSALGGVQLGSPWLTRSSEA